MNVALIGYGKMGREIEKILLERGHSVPVIIDRNNLSDFTPEHFRLIDAAIEFTTPDTAFDNIVKCLRMKVPVVCGTTAWLDRYQEALAICAREDGTFFYASNYSIGVNVFFRINQLLARTMNRFPDYDVTLEETHHTRKLDAPSGTAVTLAGDIVQELDRKQQWVGSHTTQPDQLGVTSVRRSVVPGIHTVTWESEADVITLSHSAKNRTGFALGAVLAAEFIQKKKGVYTMDDLLQL